MPSGARGAETGRILLDASGLIALLGNEPAAPEVQDILDGGGAGITTINLAESVDRLARRYGVSIDRSRDAIDGLLDGALRLIPLGAAEAWRAAEIRATHYHRSTCPISLADAVLVASAGGTWRIATADGHLTDIAAREGVEVLVLPDSGGRLAR